MVNFSSVKAKKTPNETTESQTELKVLDNNNNREAEVTRRWVGFKPSLDPLDPQRVIVLCKHLH